MIKCRAKVRDIEKLREEDKEFIDLAEKDGFIKDGWAYGYYVSGYVDGYITGNLIGAIEECAGVFEHYVAVDVDTVEVVKDNRCRCNCTCIDEAEYRDFGKVGIGND